MRRRDETHRAVNQGRGETLKVKARRSISERLRSLLWAFQSLRERGL